MHTSYQLPVILSFIKMYGNFYPVEGLGTQNKSKDVRTTVPTTIIPCQRSLLAASVIPLPPVLFSTGAGAGSVSSTLPLSTATDGEGAAAVFPLPPFVFSSGAGAGEGAVAVFPLSPATDGEGELTVCGVSQLSPEYPLAQLHPQLGGVPDADPPFRQGLPLAPFVHADELVAVSQLLPENP